MSPKQSVVLKRVAVVVERLRVEAVTATSFANRAAANGSPMLAADLVAMRARLADYADKLDLVVGGAA